MPQSSLQWIEKCWEQWEGKRLKEGLILDLQFPGGRLQ